MKTEKETNAVWQVFWASFFISLAIVVGVAIIVFYQPHPLSASVKVACSAKLTGINFRIPQNSLATDNAIINITKLSFDLNQTSISVSNCSLTSNGTMWLSQAQINRLFINKSMIK